MTVFDSSALLAYLQGEDGADAARRRLLDGGAVGSANWSEVAQKTGRRGGWRQSRALLLSFPLTVEPVTVADAERAAELWEPGSGLSLADRLCLALGERLDVDVLTADTAWAGRPRVVPIR